MNWKDIKLLSLQKMDLVDGNEIEMNDSTNPYLSKMWGAANECMSMIATAGKYIVKRLEITQHPIPNLLAHVDQQGAAMFWHIAGDISYATNGQSYYFEVDGVGIVYIEKLIQGVWVIQKTINTIKGWKAFRGLVNNPTKLPVRIRFSGMYLYNYRNVAMYEYMFASEADVPSYGAESRYDMTELASDFYSLPPDFLKKYGQEACPKHRMEGEHVILFDALETGTFLIEYFAYPNYFTPTTADNTVIQLDQESAVLLPLYISSQLFKDDDISRAVTWRNEFEVAYERLRNSVTPPKAKVIASRRYGAI